MPPPCANSKQRWNAGHAFGSIRAQMTSHSDPILSRARNLTGFASTVSAAVLALLACTAASAQTDPPVPALGQDLPAHAAGGWPTATGGDDKKPARTAEQQAQLDAVAGELKRLANECGPDSVVLQAKLLIRCMSAGAVGPTEVRVADASGPAHPGYLEIDIETGLFFDVKTTTPESRRDTIWKDVALPVLDEMVSFKIDPSAVELVFLYDVQDFSAGTDSVADPGAPSVHEAFRAQLSRAVLEDLISNRLAGEAVREKVVFTPEAVAARRAAEPVR